MICGKKNPQVPLLQEAAELEKVVKTTSFSQHEVKEMYRRFMEITRGAMLMDRVKFREIMGFVENQSSKNIVDRIFESLAETDGVGSR